MELIKLVRAIWQYSVWSRLLLLCFTVGTLATHIAGVQLSPLFVWGMYSEKMESGKTQAYYDVIANGERFDPFSAMSHPGRHLLYRSLRDWDAMNRLDGQDHHQRYLMEKLPAIPWTEPPYHHFFNSTEDFEQYPEWFKAYLGRFTGVPVDSLQIYKVESKFTNNGWEEEQRTKLPLP